MCFGVTRNWGQTGKKDIELALAKIPPKTYVGLLAELDFTNLRCDLEDHDVDVMGLLDDDTRENMKIFKTIRAIIAVLTGTKDLTTAGKILSEHLKYGGSMDEVMGAFTEAMKTAGFGEEAEETPKNSGKKTKAATE